MASPFAAFRKHQKAMMAVVGILCMIAFAIGGVTTGLVSNGRGQNPIVASTKTGKLHESDIAALARSRNLANRFMREALVAAYGLERLFQFQLPYEEIFGPSSESPLVETMLLSDKAASLGVVVSDDRIYDFLREQTSDRVTSEQYDGILRSLGSSKAQVFAALRHELLALNLRNLFLSSLQFTPAQRWDYYRRLNLRATAEILPLPVADFIADIPDPPAEKLREFFEKHKHSEPQPGSPTPGFKIPEKAAIQYLRAEYDKFFDESAVTEQEIVDFYEKNKEDLYKTVNLGGSSLFDPNSGFTPPTFPDATPPDKEKTPALETPAEQKPPATPPGEAPKAPQPEGGDSAAPPTGAPASPDQPAAPKAPEGASVERRSALRLVSLRADELALQDGQNPPGQIPAASDTQPAAVPANSPEAQPGAATPPAATDSPSAKPEATPAQTEPGTQTPAPAADSTPPASEPAAPVRPLPPPAIASDLMLEPDIEKGPPPKYEPLWKVEASIRKQLAGEHARKKIDEALQNARNRMRAYMSQYLLWKSEQSGPSPAARPKPAELDMNALAAESGLTVERTNLISAYEASRLPGIGQSVSGRAPFPLYFFRGLDLYQPGESEDRDGNRYLFWKTEKSDARVPELDQVRDEALRVWKTIQAREPALKRAKEMAQRARESQKSLKSAYDEQTAVKVIEAGPFSWLTTGSAGNFNMVPPTLSEVEGIEDPGNDFMRETFRLKVGDVGVTMNQPQSIAYILRVTSLEPSESVLRDLFMAADYRTYIQASVDDRQRLFAAWAENLKTEAGLHWVRDPVESQTE